MSYQDTITGYESSLLRVPERTVGDSQTHIFETDEFDYLYLELATAEGFTGVGIDLIELRSPGKPSARTLESRVEAIVEDLIGESPIELLNRQSRHRGGVHDYYASGSYGAGIGLAVDMALWDAVGKARNAPVWKVMGGTESQVPVYASGLSFVNELSITREVYERFRSLGSFDAAKVKVGHESADADLDRLELVTDVMDGLDRLMIDPNEAWSPKETLRRIQRFREAGFDIFWVEDPVVRADIAGMSQVVDSAPNTHVTVGEYQGFEAKRSVLDANACDILNLQGLSAARRAATLAQATGTPIALSTDHGTDVTAVHAGIALPDVVAIEFCYHRLFELSEEPPFVIEDGRARPPQRPGHGVSFDTKTVQEYAR